LTAHPIFKEGKRIPGSKVSSKTMKRILVVIGFIALAIGVIGIFIPLVPTTPFLLLSAGCFFRGSDRIYRWLMNHQYLGEYIRNFREHQSIPLSTKIISVSLLWVTILFSIIFIVKLLFLRIFLVLIAITVTIHILHYKTYKKEE